MHKVNKSPGGTTYIPLHVVITDQILSFFTQNTDMPKDWKVTLTTDRLWKKDTHIADHSPGANKDTQSPTLKATITLFTDDRKPWVKSSKYSAGELRPFRDTQ